MDININCIRYANPVLLNDSLFFEEMMVNSNVLVLNYSCSNMHQKDRQMSVSLSFISLVPNGRYALQFASDGFRNDEQFAKQALEVYRILVSHFLLATFQDHEFMETMAMYSLSLSLKLASDALWNDQVFACNPIGMKRHALQYASNDSSR